MSVTQDVQYNLRATHSPSLNTYQERQEVLVRQGAKRPFLCSSFPPRARSSTTWHGSTIDFKKLTYELTLLEVEEIEETLRSFKDRGLSLNEISTRTFKLPTLGQKLNTVTKELFEGTGIASLSGLNPDKYSLEDNIIIQAGVSGYVAPIRGSQSGTFDQVFHICSREHVQVDDLKMNSTALELGFHIDDTDILAFYCIGTPIAGGEMLWASHGQVYNHIAATRPEVLGVLAHDDWPFEVYSSQPTYEPMPILCAHEEGPFFWAARGNLVGTPKNPRPKELPILSLEQSDALDAVQFAAVENAVRVIPRKGNMYFVNNLAVMHSRTAYQDDTDPGGNRRHILRMWLRHPDHKRKMDARLEQRWEEVFDAENSKRGRWCLTKDMRTDVVSYGIFKRNFPNNTISTCGNS